MSRRVHDEDADVLPLYLVFDASATMVGNPIATVNRLVGEVVALVSSDLQLSDSVRLCIVGLDDRARRLLSLSDLDATSQVPPAVAGDHPVVEAGALIGLRVTIDDDWQQLGSDKLLRKRPVVVLFSAADPVSEVDNWAQPLHDPANLIEEDGKIVWPPELVVVGVGNARADDLAPLEVPDATVLLAGDTDGYDAAIAMLSDLLLDKIADDHRLLRRWAVTIHELEPLIADGIEGGVPVLRPADPVQLEGVNAPMRVVRYPTPRLLGDGVRAVLRQLPLQVTDLAPRLRHEGIVAAWPLRLVLSDDDKGTVLGFLEAQSVTDRADRRTRLMTDIRCGSGEAADLGSKMLDRILNVEENVAAFGMRACRRLAVAVNLLHSRGVVLGEALVEARVDVDDLTVFLYRMDLAEAPDSEYDSAARFHDDCCLLAETIAVVLSADLGRPGELGFAGSLLLQRARDQARHDAPLPQEWIEYLDQCLVDLIGRPRILRTEIAPQAVLRGGRVRVMWEMHFAETLTIHTPGNRTETVSADRVADGNRDVTITEPGWVRLVAHNDAGDTDDPGAWVHVFELGDLLGPAAGQNPLATVSLPELPLLPTVLSASEIPSYSQVAAYSSAVGATTSIVGDLSGALADNLHTVIRPVPAAIEDGLPNPLAPAAWFSRPPRLPRTRRRRWKRYS